MKRLLEYIGVFILITAFMLLFTYKNFPQNIAEICLSNVVSPEVVSSVMEEFQIYDYVNIYDIFSYEETASVYDGNISIIIGKSDVEERGIRLSKDEVIIGSKYVQKHFKYNPLGEKYISSFGEFDVNCIIQDNDRLYYKNTDILKKTDVKGQKIYIYLHNSKKLPIRYNNVIDRLKYYGINVSNSIYYSDVVKSLEKFMLVLLIAEASALFLTFSTCFNKNLKKISESYKASKYDLEFTGFIIKTENIKLVLKLSFKLLLALALGVSILYMMVWIMNIPLSYSIDFTSLNSITEAIEDFIDMMRYYIINGFTDVSFLIVKFAIIYVLSAIAVVFMQTFKIIKNR